MFIKKDKRKISEIIADPADSRAALRLARRGPEFDGDTTQLLRAEHAPAFRATTYLSLYNNKLAKISGFSTLAAAGAPLEALVLSANELPALPASLGGVAGTLARLWAEDNALSFSALPAPLRACARLRVLRLSNNAITGIDGIDALPLLEELAVDGNALAALPRGIGALRALRTLQVRGNALAALPDELCDCAALEALYASSNRLAALPARLGDLPRLAVLAVNANPALARLPRSLARAPALRRVVVAACGISALPLSLVAAWATVLPRDVVAGAAVLAAAAAAAAAGEGDGAAASGSDADAEDGGGGASSAAAAAAAASAADAEEDAREWADAHAAWAARASAGDVRGGTAGAALRDALRGARAEDALFFLPFEPAAAGASPPAHVNLDGNPVVALARGAAARRAAALDDLAAALLASGAGDDGDASAARASPVLLATEGAGAQLAMAAAARRAAAAAARAAGSA